jgi:hypothetical protein
MQPTCPSTNGLPRSFQFNRYRVDAFAVSASIFRRIPSSFSDQVRLCFCFAGFTGRDPREDTHLTVSQTSSQSKLNVRLTESLPEKNGSFNGTGDRFGS